MRLLLDTHIALWAIVANPADFPRPAQDLIADPENSIFVSAASVWEITIKHGLARGGANNMPISGPMALRFFRQAGYELAVNADHAAAVETVPSLIATPSIASWSRRRCSSRCD